MKDAPNRLGGAQMMIQKTLPSVHVSQDRDLRPGKFAQQVGGPADLPLSPSLLLAVLQILHPSDHLC